MLTPCSSFFDLSCIISLDPCGIFPYLVILTVPCDPYCIISHLMMGFFNRKIVKEGENRVFVSEGGICVPVSMHRCEESTSSLESKCHLPSLLL